MDLKKNPQIKLKFRYEKHLTHGGVNDKFFERRLPQPPMKIAFISDVHSNMDYFNRILALIDGEGVDEIYSLGDLVGYYDCPHEVIQTCIASGIKCVRGNHDNYLLGAIGYDSRNEPFYRLKEQRECLTDDDLRYLLSMPDFIDITISEKRFYMTHSLPGNCGEYLNDITAVDPAFFSKYDYYCFGHTHRPYLNYHFGCCVMNPGSVGQPRDYSTRPSFVVLDLAEESAKLFKPEIDYRTYCASLRETGYPEQTVKILERSIYEIR